MSCSVPSSDSAAAAARPAGCGVASCGDGRPRCGAPPAVHGRGMGDAASAASLSRAARQPPPPLGSRPAARAAYECQRAVPLAPCSSSRWPVGILWRVGAGRRAGGRAGAGARLSAARGRERARSSGGARGAHLLNGLMSLVSCRLMSNAGERRDA